MTSEDFMMHYWRITLEDRAFLKKENEDNLLAKTQYFNKKIEIKLDDFSENYYNNRLNSVKGENRKYNDFVKKSLYTPQKDKQIIMNSNENTEIINKHRKNFSLFKKSSFKNEEFVKCDKETFKKTEKYPKTSENVQNRHKKAISFAFTNRKVEDEEILNKKTNLLDKCYKCCKDNLLTKKMTNKDFDFIYGWIYYELDEIRKKQGEIIDFRMNHLVQFYKDDKKRKFVKNLVFKHGVFSKQEFDFLVKK